MEDQGMTTFQVKMNVLVMLGENATRDKANEIYDWLMKEVDISEIPKEVNVNKMN